MKAALNNHLIAKSNRIALKSGLPYTTSAINYIIHTLSA